jgi:hypothetical protein
VAAGAPGAAAWLGTRPVHGRPGALVSNLEDLTRFFGALLGGRLLPPGCSACGS